MSPLHLARQKVRYLASMTATASPGQRDTQMTAHNSARPIVWRPGTMEDPNVVKASFNRPITAQVARRRGLSAG